MNPADYNTCTATGSTISGLESTWLSKCKEKTFARAPGKQVKRKMLSDSDNTGKGSWTKKST